MIIYLILIIFILILDFLNNSKKQKFTICRLSRNKLSAFLISSFIFIIMGFRAATVGTDTYSYMMEYRSYFNFNDISMSNPLSGEIGYKYLQIFFKYLNFEWQSFVMFTSLLSCYSFYRFTTRYSKDITLTFLLHITIGLFAMSLTGIRQTIAISLCLLAYLEYEQRNILKVVVYMLIAISIHFSSIIFIATFFIKTMKVINRNRIMIISFFPIICRIFGDNFLSLVNFVLPRKYEYSGYYDTLNLSNSTMLETGTILLYLLITIGLLMQKKVYQDTFELYIMTSLYMTMFALSYHVYMAGRLSYYYVFPLIILISNIISNISNHKARFIIRCLCIILSIMTFIYVNPKSSFGIYEYSFFNL